MTKHRFTLLISGLVDEHIDELFEAGCDDATFGSVDGVYYADFAREADNLGHAVVDAIHQVESVRGLRVTRVEPENLVTASEIADRLGRTRESIRLLATGERGDGSFPAPVSHVRTRMKLWRWSDIAHWADQISTEEMIDAHFLAAVNGALEMRNESEQLPAPDRRLVEQLTH